MLRVDVLGGVYVMALSISHMHWTIDEYKFYGSLYIRASGLEPVQPTSKWPIVAGVIGAYMGDSS